MPAERELDLSLLDDSVDPAQSIRRRVWQRGQSRQGRLEIRQRLLVRPPALGLLSSQDRIVHCLLDVVAAAEVISEQLDHIVEPSRELLLEGRRDRPVILASFSQQQTFVDNI